jgi:hypothetical protein
MFLVWADFVTSYTLLVGLIKIIVSESAELSTSRWSASTFEITVFCHIVSGEFGASIFRIDYHFFPSKVEASGPFEMLGRIYWTTRRYSLIVTTKPTDASLRRIILYPPVASVHKM